MQYTSGTDGQTDLSSVHAGSAMMRHVAASDAEIDHVLISATSCVVYPHHAGLDVNASSLFS